MLSLPNSSVRVPAVSVAPTEERCQVCTTEVRTMAFRGTGVCGEIHRKMRDGEPLEPARAAG